LASRAASAAGLLDAFVVRDLPGAGGVFLQASEDPAIRAALFVVNDLALILVRHPIANGYSCRPLTPEGIDREATAVYAEGAFSAPRKE